MKPYDAATLLLSVTTCAALLPKILAMPFVPPVLKEGSNLSTRQTDHFPDDQTLGFGHQLDDRGIDEQETIAFANITFYSAKQDDQEDSSCGHSYMAPYVPVMSNDDFTQSEYFHDAGPPEESRGGDVQLGPVTRIQAGALGSPAVKCPPYEARLYPKRPLSALAWWDRQKMMDRRAISKLGPSPLVPRIPPAPRFIVYECCGDSDGRAPLPTPKQLGPVNVLNLAFLTFLGPMGSLEKFFKLSVAERRKWIHSMHAAGVSVIMSTFGQDDKTAVTSHFDPVVLGRLHGQIVRESSFDGLDIDLEDFDATFAQSQAFTGWMEAYVKAARREIPAGKYALTAAPVASWFTTNTQRYCSGLYRTIDKRVGHLHDWYNLQYYNQGQGTYSTCADILTRSDQRGFPDSSIFEIHEKAGVDLQKLVIGKPAPGEADSGVVSAERLAKCVEQAKAKGWRAGVMAWQRPKINAEWFETVRGQAFPPGGKVGEASIGGPSLLT